jgi:carbonic anhydrase/acetyltransferase-like protein (isoleucine patch superfamily)
MKALLICPAFRPAVPQLAEDAPLALAPILGEGIVSHWLEHLAGLGAREVQVVAADRADQVRATLGDGARWGLRLEVRATSVEPTPAEAAAQYRPAGETGWLPAPHDIVLMDHLPGCSGLPLFESYASWFAALLAWMPRALTPARVRVTEICPGIWVGRRAHVSATAKLIAPCWIGDQVFVEPNAVVGPGAIVENRSVIENDARVAQSWIGPDTFVGPMTALTSSLAWGSSLTNWRSDSSLEVPDPFLMCSLAPRVSPRLKRLPHGSPARSNPATESPLKWIASWREPATRTQDSTPPA